MPTTRRSTSKKNIPEFINLGKHTIMTKAIALIHWSVKADPPKIAIVFLINGGNHEEVFPTQITFRQDSQEARDLAKIYEFDIEALIAANAKPPTPPTPKLSVVPKNNDPKNNDDDDIPF